MKRLVTTILICTLICISAILPVQALPLPQNGFSLETTVITSEVENANAEQILEAVSRIITENQDDPHRFQIIFPYAKNSITFSRMVNWMLGDLDDAICGLWPCGDTFAYVSVSAQRTTYSEYRLLVQVDTAAAYDPTGKLTALYTAIRDIGESAKTAAKTERDQLRFINRRLCELITYDIDADPYNPYVALIEGRAACSGYTASMTLLCRYLGILSCTVSGPGHVWNSVYIDGEWLMLDVTWNDSASNQEQYFLIKQIADNSGSHNTDSDIVTTVRAAARAHHPYYLLPEQYRTASAWSQSLSLDTGNDKITRGELATLLASVTGNKALVLAAPATYAAGCAMIDVRDELRPYIGFCVKAGLMYGYGNGLFGPDDTASINDACTVALRMIDYDETKWNYSSARDTACELGLLPVCYIADEPITKCAIEHLLYNATISAGGAYGG